MVGGLKYVIDALAGAALVLALLMVLVVDYFIKKDTSPGENTLTVHIIEAKGQDSKRLRLAVTPTARDKNPQTQQMELWDDMGKLLDELGKGYRHDEIAPQDLLLNPKELEKYDVLFLTCAPGGEELKDVLRTFVAGGGILYASDWRYDAIATAFPDMVDSKTRAKGASQRLDADIVDPALRDLLGDTIHLRFDLGEWKTAGFRGPRVKTLIRGKYLKQNDITQKAGQKEYAVAPLMVKFTFGKGTVIFTSFHNEKQNSEVEKKLLQYVVFSLVTAGIDSEVTNTMAKEGFTPQRSNLLSTPRDNPSVSKNYENGHVGTLRFALGFRSEGAKLRLNIKSPEKTANGEYKQYTVKDVQSTMVVEVPNAAKGTWTYAVTALDLPYENFPFTMTVGEKKQAHTDNPLALPYKNCYRLLPSLRVFVWKW